MSVETNKLTKKTSEPEELKFKLSIDNYREYPTGAQMIFTVPGKRGKYCFELTDEMKNTREDHVIIKVEE